MAQGRTWWNAPFWLSLAGGALVWAALPPLGWWPLAWIAPLFWLQLIRQEQLSAGRPYVAIWFSSVLFWAVTLQGIRLAHWANYLGLVALAAYLGVYMPLAIAAARHAVHRWRVPVVLAAPVAWTGMEMLRGYGPLGFSMATLAHTQVHQLSLIQIADLGGAYTVSFALMSVSASLSSAWHSPARGRRIGLVLCALAWVALVVTYGQYRLRDPVRADQDQPRVRVALIQGSIDTVFDDQPDRWRQILDQYSGLTQQACDRYGPFDLVVWPESMFPPSESLFEAGAELTLEPGLDRAMLDASVEQFRSLVRYGIGRINRPAARGAAGRPTCWLLGTTTWQFGPYPSRRYNAALMINPDAEVTARYFKMHPVMFGEYVPFGDIWPSLYNLFPLPNGLTPGTEPVAIPVGKLTFSPSICFESTIPHLIRWQAVELARRGTRPDVLVNLTNDGWFWGSSILDLHLDCAVLRAVELRRPVLVAANTGFSAWIDGQGAIRARGPRRAPGVIVADVAADGRWSGYELWGDGPAWFCATCSLAALAAAACGRAARRLRAL